LSTELYFGKTHYKALQTIGGTGALSLVNLFLNTVSKIKTIWVSNPTWENHNYIFSNFKINQYEYLNSHHIFDFNLMYASIVNIPDYEIILLHGCAHNPTGYDLNENELRLIINLCKEKNLYIIIDLAYSGFASGNFQQDCTALRILNESRYPSIICTSYSKNFGMYSDRVGLIFVSENTEETTNHAYSIIKGFVRKTYSSPPSHGATIISHILGNVEYKQRWFNELVEINNYYCSIRHEIKNKLEEILKEDFSDIILQKGMFWYSRSHLSNTQINYLVENHVHIIKNGRINISSLNASNIDMFIRVFIEAKNIKNT
jgi:aspartate/tyrosine/aromatic aminotransferase